MSLALVTGGNRRIGAYIAATLARAGYDLALHHFHHAGHDPVLAQALQETGVAYRDYAADLGDETACMEMLSAIEKDFGRAPDVLVNNASLFGWDTPDDSSMTQMQTAFAINAAAPILLARSLAAQASAEAPRVVVNILDQRVDHPHGDNLAYTLGKYALLGATRILARHYAPHVRVLGVAPGLTLAAPEYSEKQMQALAQQMPLGQLPHAQDIADAVRWCVQARAVTGQVIYVDGGAHMESYRRDFLFLAPEA